MTDPGTAQPSAGPDPPPASHQPTVASGGLWANHDFRVVLGGQILSAFGDALTITAMPLLVLSLTGSAALMGIVAALQMLPDLILGLVAGAVADRWDRRRLLVWADAGRALLTLTIPVAFWLGLPTLVVILAVVVPINVLRLLSDAALSSAIPGLVGRDHLQRANGYLEATLSVPFIVGPAVAGVLVATIGAAATLALDAGSFAASAVAAALIRRRLLPERTSEVGNLVAEIREGLAFVWHHAVIRAIIGYWTVIQVATAALIPTLAYYVTIDRGFGPVLFGLVGSAWSGGYLIGSLVGGRLDRPGAAARMAIAGGIGGVAVGAMAIAAFPLALLAAGAIVGASVAVIFVSYATLRVLSTPDGLLGRVGSTARTLTFGLQPVGLLASGVITDAAGGGSALVVMSVIILFSTVVFGRSRTVRGPATVPA